MSKEINSTNPTDARTGIHPVVTIMLGVTLAGGGAAGVYKLHLFDPPAPTPPVQVIVHRDLRVERDFPSERESQTRRPLRSNLAHVASHVADHVVDRLFSRHDPGSVAKAKQSQTASHHSSQP